MSTELVTPNPQFYASIIYISLIYFSGIFIILKLVRFIQFSLYIHVRQPFFQTRQPKGNTLYISLFIFTLYILNPLTLVLPNLYDGNYRQITLYIHDVSNTLIFISFFIRLWILWFDQYFIDTVTNWKWRREVDLHSSQTNKLIKYSTMIQSNRHLIIILFYILCIAPIFIALLIISHNTGHVNHFIFENIIDFYRIIYLIIFIILLSVTYYVSYNKLYVSTDQYYIRSQLIHSIKCGFLYTIALSLSSVSIHVHSSVISDWTMISNVMFTHMVHLCILYYTSYWTQKQFQFMHLFNHCSTFFSIFSKKQKIKFKHFMNNKQAINLFSHQLVDQFGLESMVFIIEVSQFKAVIKTKYPSYANDNDDLKENKPFCTDNTLFSVSNILNINWMPINNRMKIHTPHKLALYLYEKYIDSSADLCINICSKNRRFIYKTFKELASELHDESQRLTTELQPPILNILYTLFDNALIEIWRLLKTDPFIRFKQSEKFKRLLFVLYPSHAKQAWQEYIETTVKQKIKPKLKLASASIPEDIDEENPQTDAETSPPVTPSIFAMNNEVKKTQSKIHHPHHRARASSMPAAMQNSFQLTVMSTPSKMALEEIGELWIKTDRQKSSDYMATFADISDKIIAPANILKTCHDFWRSNINNSCEANKLEIGTAIFMALITEDSSIMRSVNRHRINQKRIQILSLQFLHMINWLTITLWNRNNDSLHSSFSKIGALHKNMNIEIKHFQLLLKILNETLNFYFPQKK
eukprot:106580_1